VSDLRVGLGVTLLERALQGAKLDGIGGYAPNLHRGLTETPSVKLLPASFPPKPWQGRLARKFPGATTFACAYGIGAAVSSATNLPFPWSKRIAGRIDVFHAPDHLIPRLREVPVVATICDALPVTRPDWIDAGPARFRSRLARSAARWADHVIAISAAMVPDLVEHLGVPDDSISVVHMGIGDEWFEPVAEERLRLIMSRHGLAEGYFLFVGTLQPRKNVERIVQAYARLPEDLRRARRLVIAGQAGWGSEDLVRTLRMLAQQGEAAWLEYVPADELRALYRGAGALVFPSLDEGFGIPVLEAFASGVPVITSNVSSLPEVAGGAALLVDPRNVEELARAMQRLAGDRQLVARLVALGRSRAREMTWSKCVQNTLDVYRKVL